MTTEPVVPGARKRPFVAGGQTRPTCTGKKALVFMVAEKNVGAPDAVVMLNLSCASLGPLQSLSTNVPLNVLPRVYAVAMHGSVAATVNVTAIFCGLFVTPVAVDVTGTVAVY